MCIGCDRGWKKKAGRSTDGKSWERCVIHIIPPGARYWSDTPSAPPFVVCVEPRERKERRRHR